MDDDHVIIRPTHLSICNADQRYYQGTRDPEVLAKKLPMALIHEGIGVVSVSYTHLDVYKRQVCTGLSPEAKKRISAP